MTARRLARFEGGASARVRPRLGFDARSDNRVTYPTCRRLAEAADRALRQQPGPVGLERRCSVHRPARCFVI
jgi:hypothetical protein